MSVDEVVPLSAQFTQWKLATPVPPATVPPVRPFLRLRAPPRRASGEATPQPRLRQASGGLCLPFHRLLDVHLSSWSLRRT